MIESICIEGYKGLADATFTLGDGEWGEQVRPAELADVQNAVTLVALTLEGGFAHALRQLDNPAEDLFAAASAQDGEQELTIRLQMHVDDCGVTVPLAVQLVATLDPFYGTASLAADRSTLSASSGNEEFDRQVPLDSSVWSGSRLYRSAWAVLSSRVPVAG